MARYWTIAHDIFPGLKPAAPPSVWRSLVHTLIASRSLRPSVADADVVAALASPGARSPDRGRRWPKTTHCIGSLGAGGAERQLVNLMTRLHALGHDGQTLLTINPLQGDEAHYAELLAEHAIDARCNNTPIREEGVELIRANPDKIDLLKRLPPEFNAWSLDLWVELSLLAPDVAHFWLDHSNIWGGPAALLADIPAVILSTRNVHPENFPYLYAPYMKTWYERLEKCSRVHFINNSAAGARSYADWLGADVDRFEVVLNGVDLSAMRRADAADREATRAEIGVPSQSRVVVGAFRMSDEKRPLLFVETVARAMAGRPDLHAVLMGEGPLREAVEARARALGIGDRFFTLGRRSDVARVMSSMDVFLHTAWWEGTPNVVLEAQQLGLPVVVSDGGGAADCVDHGRTGLLVSREDEAGFASALFSVLDDLAVWRERAAAGPSFIASRFSIDGMVERTLSVQKRAIGVKASPLTNAAAREALSCAESSASST